ncbi:hypothetical protein N7539_006566 [Penicillium diatomitis]|uniref:Major facilitator superfamily (MFS) profile domain-containing protein n=1 Tax=Penicillium diatomitis TaxID=2819901 RepID=A0A9W9X246_9EURO|nr:uncharacterized protein N7539_006566 [Penicillium diatomitis]KAJ5480672.1 hypothetical protein N7539_006566 [Penicillium diatomitis]
MTGHIKFADPVGEKKEVRLCRRDTRDTRDSSTIEKGSIHRPQSPGNDVVYLEGWQLVLTAIGLLIGFFLSNLDVTIVSSSLTNITDSLEGFEKRSWIITGYLATYTGFMAIWTKASDIVGRKHTTIAALVILLVFSIACGCAQTVDQLIVFRALQGIGGAGAYALAILCIYEIAPRKKLPFYSALMSCCLALACLIGPIIGGVLAEDSAWRWVFFINAPLCAIAIIIVLVAMPKNFGLDQHKPSFRTRASYRSFVHLDLVGSLLIITGSFLIVTVFNETNLAFSWSSGGSIALLVLTGISWIAFFAWEIYISDIPGKDPIFPRRWFQDRAWMGILFTSFVTGAPFNVVLVYVPQQAQILLNKSPLDSGVYLIGYSAVAAAAAALINFISAKGRIPFIYSLLVGCIVHTVGIGLLSTIASTEGFHATDIVYGVIAGIGIGIIIGVLMLCTPYIVEDRDLGRLFPHELHILLENVGLINGLGTALQREVKDVIAASYTTQLRVMIGFAAVQLPAVLLLLQRGKRPFAVNRESND